MEESLRKRGNDGGSSIVESRAEAEDDSKIRKVFDELDLDHDGYIGKEELRVCLALMGQPVREETLNIMIKLGDRNNDGFIDFEEFKSLMTNPKPRIKQVIEERSVIKAQQVQLVSAAIVPSRKGEKKVDKRAVTQKLTEISKADLANLDPVSRRLRTIEIVHALLGIDTIRPKDIKVLHKKFQEADTKKVGKLRLNQFEKIFDSYNFIDNRKTKSNAITLLFSFCDQDNSSLIDAKEFIIGLCWLSDFSNIDKLRFAFMLFDANGNGKMDRDELIQLIASVNMGGEADRAWIAARVDEVFEAIAPTEAWREYELSFEQLVSIADHNPDLFESMGT
jgi:Ca2+-binding EF-hand superfamily protein